MRKLRYCFSVMMLGAILFAACGKASDDRPLPTLAPQETEAPEETATPEPTAKPTSTPKPTPTPMGTNLPAGVNLLNTYGKTFGRIGTCVTLNQFSDPTVMALVKQNYNSITMENEMKPDAILRTKQLSIEEAKELGYVIPENYKESTVPELSFYSADRAMQVCAENNLGLRGHTLVWHSQTPTWFFREGYQRNGAFVSPEVMDARMEFYIRSVMGHIYDNENGYVVYSWDVVNEYVHAENSGWEAVYGDQGLQPTFVKKAFEIADDVLCRYGIREQVSLLYNDFNTYSDTLKILKLLEFVNSDKEVCDGVGMQSHLTAPSNPPVIKYKMAVEDFLEAGHEVYITELDVESSIDMYQANYYHDMMEDLLEMKQNGAEINGITYWGVSDVTSWRKSGKPLLFSTPSTPKLAYYKVLEAYVNMGLYEEE